MTLITRFPGTGWDSSLPAAPKMALQMGFRLNHEYSAARISGAAGSAVTSWADVRGSAPLTNAVGGVLRSENGANYVELSGLSGSLMSTFPAGEVQTLIILARINPTAPFTGAGPVLGFQETDGIVQGAADVANLRVAKQDANLPAARGKWHMYAVTVPAAGNALVAVDGASVAFAPFRAGIDRITLGILVSDRRALQIAHVMASPDALTAGQLVQAHAALKNSYPELTW